MTTQSHMKPRDKWIPWYFVTFFLVLFVLDGIFVTLAVSSHRGVVTEKSYQKGLHYNDTVKAVETQAKLGWKTDITLQENTLLFSLKDKQGASINQAQVTAYFTRPTQAGSDFSTQLDFAQDGIYSQAISFPLKGLWDVRVVAAWNQQQYQTHKRIIAH